MQHYSVACFREKQRQVARKELANCANLEGGVIADLLTHLIELMDIKEHQLSKMRAKLCQTQR